MHGHPFAGRDTALVDHGTKGRHEPATEAGSRGEVHFFGNGNQIGVGVIDRDIFGIGTPCRKTGLELVLTDLVIAGGALEAMAAGCHERHGHTRAGFPVVHLAARGHDDAGKFMPWHMRQADIWIVPHPAVPVASAQPGRGDLDHHAVGRGNRIRHSADHRCFPEFFEHDGLHR